jgi:Asp-tRNA(Asn)/Glu-tRNA(Gln) amidotransferase A subunit family amidase
MGFPFSSASKACLSQIHRYDNQLNAFMTLREEEALAEASACDGLRKSGKK